MALLTVVISLAGLAAVGLLFLWSQALAYEKLWRQLRRDINDQQEIVNALAQQQQKLPALTELSPSLRAYQQTAAQLLQHYRCLTFKRFLTGWNKQRQALEKQQQDQNRRYLTELLAALE